MQECDKSQKIQISAISEIGLGHIHIIFHKVKVKLMYLAPLTIRNMYNSYWVSLSMLL